MFLRIRASMAGMKWPLRSSSRRVWLAAALIGLLAAGGGLALAYNEKVSPDRYVPQGAERQWGEFIGRTPQQILNDVLARYGGDAVVAASIDGPPPDYQPNGGPGETGKWAYFTVRASSESREAIRAIWEADLVAGVLRDGMLANGEVLFSTRTSLLLPDGTTIPNVAGGIGNVSPNEQFNTPPAKEVPNQIENAASAAGLHVQSIQVLLPAQPAPVVVATIEDPTAVSEEWPALATKIFGQPPTYEGYYLEVRDTEGRPIFIQATDFRIGAGHQWNPAGGGARRNALSP
jgi:hypothetical protein